MCTRYVAKLENFLFKMTKKKKKTESTENTSGKKKEHNYSSLNTRRISFKINKYEQD